MIQFVIDAMVDAVVVVDAEGRITLSNSGAARLTGYSAEELLQMPVGKLLVDDNSGLRTVVRRRVEGGDVLRREQSWLVTRAGERIPVSITGSPVIDDAGGLQGIVLVARDVRELRQLLADKEAEIARRRAVEEELRQAKSSIETQLDQARTQLQLAERRATLGTLAGGVGHELRNIAQVQVAAVDELAAAIAANEDVVALALSILPELERVGEHITQHGNRLMQLARPGPDHVAPIDLNMVVIDVAAMLRMAGKLRKIATRLELADKEVTVTVNRTRIEQILVNLIVNAVDAMGDTGTLTIRTRTSPDGSRVICEIHDTGPGIAPENLERIFEPFFTTKGGEKGTGLGLPVAREIAVSYGGELRVETTPGTGTTFTFELPR